MPTELKVFSANVVTFLTEQEIKYLKEYETLCLKYGFIITDDTVKLSTDNNIAKRMSEISRVGGVV